MLDTLAAPATCDTEILLNAANRETFIFEGPPGLEDGSFRVVLGEGGSGGGNGLVHVHPGSDEHFEVLKGRLRVEIAGAVHVVEAGQSVVVPRGAAHHFRNAHAGVTECRIRFSPPLRQRGFFRNFAWLAQHRPHWFSEAGDPPLLLVALVLNAYPGHLYLAGPPIWLQRLLFAVLAPVARWRGYGLAPDGDVSAR